MTSDISPTDFLFDEINCFLSKDVQNHFKSIQQQYEELKQLNEKPSIVLIGQSGVGKSSLINTIFKEEIATEGETTQTTQTYNQYANE